MGAIAVLFIISIIISEILAGSNNKDAQKKVGGWHCQGGREQRP
jgi:hypothetical protein